ncbi:uncharacterized protein N0V89_010094 [Didymosphaeria variabile]|uniref:Phosphoglycerate mutase-like protein n=1 Tax=Didymosphaeria variabile TaxID=1932322 RepID=A0A9W9C7Z2_9PLEO|nr:uncharacterized protein N0V89_010094 [Didymosphaeria variabile]KAJ4348716.1 hypothetical protein N0V89_010094 [Didymosphaeria variabile]
MPPTQLHLIRHAQGYHNLREDYNLPDTLLTPEGEQQSIALSHEIPDIFSINCIYASPMRRTLYTALLTFRTVLHFNPNLRIIALPELQETSDFACDTGSPLAQLRKEFEGKPVDFSHVFEGWNDKKSGRFRPTTGLTEQRAGEARRVIREEAEGFVAVVAHGGVNHYFTEDWEGSSSGSGTGWKNCEFRTYKFDDSSSSAVEWAAIVETEGSIRRRFPTGDYRELTPIEQYKLRDTTEKSWAADGYISLGEADEFQNKASNNHKGEWENGKLHEERPACLVAG